MDELLEDLCWGVGVAPGEECLELCGEEGLVIGDVEAGEYPGEVGADCLLLLVSEDRFEEIHTSNAL